MKNLDKKTASLVHQYVEEFEQRTHATVVYLTLSGSKLYGTDNENSDIDIKGIFVPSRQSVLLKKDLEHYVRDTNNSKVKNSKDDVDFTLHSIYSFLNHLVKSETGSVDELFSMFRDDTIIYENKEFTSIIKENYKHFLNKNMKSFIGYALGQTKKFGIKGARYNELDTFVNDFRVDWGNDHDDKLQTKFEDLHKYIEDKNFKYIKFVFAAGQRRTDIYKKVEYISVLGKMFEGTVTVEYFYDRISKLYNQFGNRTKTVANTESKTDFKALSHALRIASEVKELLETSFIKFPLKNAEHIKDIKAGKLDVQESIDEIQDILAEVDELLLTSELPEEVDEELINLMVLRTLDEFSL